LRRDGDLPSSRILRRANVCAFWNRYPPRPKQVGKLLVIAMIPILLRDGYAGRLFQIAITILALHRRTRSHARADELAGRNVVEFADDFNFTVPCDFVKIGIRERLDLVLRDLVSRSQ